MLSRQSGNEAIEPESFRFNFRSHIRDAHPVRRSDRNARIFFAILDQHQFSVGSQCPAEASKHLLRMPQLVIHVDEQRQVDGVFRKMRVDFAALNDDHVRQMFGLYFVLDDAKHGRLNVVGEHLAAWPHEPCKACCHIPGAGANVCDDHSGANADQCERLLWRFLVLTRRAVEPARVGGDACDLPSGQRMNRRPLRRDQTRAGIERDKPEQADKNEESPS